MKKTIFAVLAVGLLSCGFAQQTQAVPVPGFTGTATLVSQNTAGFSITVDYNVDLTLGVYTYNYIINNTAGGSNPDTFGVSFDNAPNVVITTSGGLFSASSPSGVNWFYLPVGPGGSSPTLSFTSLVGPTFGNAQATDTNPPSPWASTNGGQQVPVPGGAVPDGGSAVTLLGIALAGIEGVRRLIRARKA